MGRTRTRKFEAKIGKVGVNPCVEVPSSISRAFKHHATSGRIHVEGMLNRTPIRAVLMPVRGGAHRLYLNGGMRSAAAVDVGDLVHVSLRPVESIDKLPLPADVAAALARMKGATAAFARLTPAHRRELIRYIDDARTSHARRDRIRKAADHVLGKRTRSSGKRTRSHWICPRCGNRFVHRNQYHSCKRHRIEDAFAGKPDAIRRLFDRFRKMVEQCGPVTIVPYRDRVGFMVEIRFAGAAPKRSWLDVAFSLPRRVEHSRMQRVETLHPNVHLHHLRITRPEDLDAQLAEWIKEAYAVGCRDDRNTAR